MYKAIVLHSHAVLSLWGTSTEKRERREQPPCLPSTVGCVRWAMAMDAYMYIQPISSLAQP
jgi:hypothetical protein